MPPRLIHMIYFPWGKDQKLLADHYAFNHRPYENMVKYAPDFEVRLWTYPEMKAFCEPKYPEAWRLIHTAARPMMMVDWLRWMVVYELGGVYWQYDMNPLAPMDRFFPSRGKRVRLFTEFVRTPEQCREAAREPIRNGEPEEPLRIVNQAFAAEPRHPFLKATMDLIQDRLATCTFKKDYDLLYISANAAVSTAYDRYGKNDESVELIPRPETRELMKIRYLGTWRTDGNRSQSAASSSPSASASRSRVSRIKARIKATPALAAGYHRWIKPHPHERVFADAAPKNIKCDPQLLDSLAELLGEYPIKLVCEVPATGLDEVRSAMQAPPEWCSGIWRSSVRPTEMDDGVEWRVFNPQYSRVPKVDCIICRNYFTFLDDREIRTALRNLKKSGSTYLLTTTYPYLNSHWPGALGDWRPLNFTLAPYHWPEPLALIPDPESRRRPDRMCGLWRLADLPLDEA